MGGRHFTLSLEGCPEAQALAERLSRRELSITLKDLGGTVKAGELPRTMEGELGELTARPGDILLLEGSRIGVCYKETAGRFILTGQLNGSPEKLRETLGDGDIDVRIMVEWTE